MSSFLVHAVDPQTLLSVSVIPCLDARLVGAPPDWFHVLLNR